MEIKKINMIWQNIYFYFSLCGLVHLEPFLFISSFIFFLVDFSLNDITSNRTEIFGTYIFSLKASKTLTLISGDSAISIGFKRKSLESQIFSADKIKIATALSQEMSL